MASAEAIAELGAAGATAMAELGRQALEARRQESENKRRKREEAKAVAQQVYESFHDQMRQMATVHHESFEPIRPDSWTVDDAAIRAFHLEAAKSATSAIQVGKRRDAVAEADRRGDLEIAQARHAIAERWHGLVANEPMVVIETLDEAFEDNWSPALAVDCEGDRVTVIVNVPGTIPDTRPELTDRGKLVNKSWTASEAAEFHLLVIASAILATVKETWAVAPSINAATIVAIAETEQLGIEGLTATRFLYQGTFTRDRHQQLAWTHIDPIEEISQAEDVKLIRKGRAKAIQPLPLDKHPDLRQLLNQMEAAWDDAPAAHKSTSAPASSAPGSTLPPPPPPPSPASAPEQPVPAPAPQPAAVQAGWYDDPWDATPAPARQLGWWDGNDWTGHIAPPADQTH